MPGRPSKLTPEIRIKICLAILDGNFRDVAARSANIGVRTMRRWLQLGKKFPDGVYAEFRHAVQEAESLAEIGAVAIITKAGKDDPNHLKWWLERKFPQRWGRQFRFEMQQIHERLKQLEKLLLGARISETPLEPEVPEA